MSLRVTSPRNEAGDKGGVAAPVVDSARNFTTSDSKVLSVMGDLSQLGNCR